MRRRRAVSSAARRGLTSPRRIRLVVEIIFIERYRTGSGSDRIIPLTFGWKTDLHPALVDLIRSLPLPVCNVTPTQAHPESDQPHVRPTIPVCVHSIRARNYPARD